MHGVLEANSNLAGAASTDQTFQNSSSPTPRDETPASCDDDPQLPSLQIPPGLFFCPTDPVSQEGRDVVKRISIFSPTESLRPSCTPYWPMAFHRFALYSSCVSQRKLRPKHPARQVIIKITRPRGHSTNCSSVPVYIWSMNRTCSPPVIPQSPPCY